MSDYDLLIQFLEILIALGGISATALFFWWRNYSMPSLATDRRQINIKVEVERRKSERRRQPRHMAYPI